MDAGIYKCTQAFSHLSGFPNSCATGYLVITEITVTFYFHFSPLNLVISYYVTFSNFQNNLVPRPKGDFTKFGLLCHFYFY